MHDNGWTMHDNIRPRNDMWRLLDADVWSMIDRLVAVTVRVVVVVAVLVVDVVVMVLVVIVIMTIIVPSMSISMSISSISSPHTISLHYFVILFVRYVGLLEVGEVVAVLVWMVDASVLRLLPDVRVVLDDRLWCRHMNWLQIGRCGKLLRTTSMLVIIVLFDATNYMRCVSCVHVITVCVCVSEFVSVSVHEMVSMNVSVKVFMNVTVNVTVASVIFSKPQSVLRVNVIAL